ncbi:DUF2921 family protein [Quillaja saponaria]|uniref:RING-type E3 ubiquitin transferase n=1 Tax=Quillaja saponaria TaxID=32244 RepID=A0AAD7M4H4_QUISA|nr:DUF2921 family protein [Quillaja saponaria]
MEANSASASFSSPLHRSGFGMVRVYKPINPSKTHKFSFTPIFIFFLFFQFNISTTTSFIPALPEEITYAQHCNHIVPISPSDNETVYARDMATSLGFQSAYSGGDPLFNQTQRSVNKYRKYLTFRVSDVHKTVSDSVYELRAILRLSNPEAYSALGNSNNRRLRMISYRGPRVLPWRGGVVFRLYGYWSESSGKLCMVGSGSSLVKSRGNVLHLNVILKLNYPHKLSIFDSLISGTVESFHDRSSSNYFRPISILAVDRNSNYEYSLVETENGNGCVGEYGEGESLSLNKFRDGACSVLRERPQSFELEYGSPCYSGNCNPLVGDVGYVPKSMYFYSTQCTDRRKLQMLLGFPDSSYQGRVFPFNPNSTLIAEGIWNEKHNQLCAVACRILNVTESWADAFVGDCSIKFNLRFPAILSLRNRSTVVGKIWSNKTVNESGYFVGKYCAEKDARSNGETYPDGYSSDMGFSMVVRNNKGQLAQGYSSPLFVGDKLYEAGLYASAFVQQGVGKKEYGVQLNHIKLLNISYKMSFTPSGDFKFNNEIASSKEVQISAEGVYDRDTGVLCMIGCWHLGSSGKELIKNESLDCEIKMNLHFPPLNAKGSEFVRGTIESTRLKSDKFYFKSLQLSSNSISTSQAAASIWRMDLEITMVLISNTLACVFVGLQLLYVKKNPDVLPTISIVMLIVLTLGHMIPLLLNFKALMANHSQQSVFLGSGGWLEVNEVIVRMVTMVAFLLQLRLLQLTWSTRRGDGSQQGFWVFERKVIYVTLPLYIGGALIAWYVHQWKNAYQSPSEPFRLSRHQFRHGQLSYDGHSLWEDLKSYAGLLLDGFLLPQILLNVFSNSEGKTLASSFYVGTTIIRLLPHAYDLYRAHSSTWYLDLSYIYANHRMDFYSTAWDIIIPCTGLSFALLVYFQQKYGSRCILPKRVRESSVYEKVPVINNDEL